MKTTRCKTTRKVRFKDKLDALIALSRRVRNDKGEKRAYFCMFCKGWHLTSQPLKENTKWQSGSSLIGSKS